MTGAPLVVEAPFPVDLEAFWESIWQYFGVEASRPVFGRQGDLVSDC